jgi:hypothetical protein
VTDLHGGLLALSEVATAYRNSNDNDDLDVRMRDVSAAKLTGSTESDSLFA